MFVSFNKNMECRLFINTLCTCRRRCVLSSFIPYQLTSLQTFEGYSCSWCDDAYHCACFNEKFREETCHLGPLRNMIIPPSWIIKLPPQIEQVGAEDTHTHTHTPLLDGPIHGRVCILAAFSDMDSGSGPCMGNIYVHIYCG